MTLADAHTTTTVAWDDSACLPGDTVVIDGVQLEGPGAERVVAHLDRLRALAGVSDRARVVSNNNFPMASGIASSASGFPADRGGLGAGPVGRHASSAGAVR